MKILEWVLAGILALVMLFAGLNKLVSDEFRDLLSDQLGLPGWLLVLVGVVELLIVVDLLMPRFRILGGVAVFFTMIGAAILNLFGDVVDGSDPKSAIPINIVLALLGLVTAWLAAGRPKDLGSLFATARSQILRQGAVE